MDARVSVILPTRNRAHMIARALRSVHAQTYPNWELIIVDDGSDTPLQIELEGRYRERTTLIRQPALGVSAARNAAIAHATGDFLALIDDDDAWRPDKLEQQLALLQSHADTGMVVGGVLSVNVNNDVSTKDIPPAIIRSVDLLEKCCVCSSTVMLRRSLVPAVGLFDRDLRIGETWDYWIRVSTTTLIRATSAIVADYYLNHGCNATSDVEGMYHDRMKVLNKHSNLVQSCPENRQAARRAVERLTSQYLTFRRLMDQQHHFSEAV